MNKVVKWVDPPEGWRHGFPAVLEDGVDYEELLRKHKYPESLIPLALKHSRSWMDHG